MEITAFQYFQEEDFEARQRTLAFLLDFVEREPGCGHIPSDRYAVSIIWATLMLAKEGKKEAAHRLIRPAAVWLFNHVDNGFGIPRYEADEFQQTKMLLGYPFDFMKVEKNRSSYLATVVSDLAAFLGDADLYADIVNDVEAGEIVYNYWQVPDTRALFMINSAEVISYPNIPHQFSITNFEDFNYSEHIKHEPTSFKIEQQCGSRCLILLSVLLKDRYFPKCWSQVVGVMNNSVNS